MAGTSHTLPALILAAGLSSRMGAFKPLLPLAGKPLLFHLIDALCESQKVGPVIVVTGHHAAEINAALQGLPVRVVFNPQYARGEMLSSLLAGIAAIAPLGAPGFLLALGDQPGVSAQTVGSLVSAFHESLPGGQPAPLVLPTYLGKRGHPVVLSMTLVPEIHALSPDESLKTVVHRHLPHARLVPVDDPGILQDLDTPDDFARAARQWPPAYATAPVPSFSNGVSHA